MSDVLMTIHGVGVELPKNAAVVQKAVAGLQIPDIFAGLVELKAVTSYQLANVTTILPGTSVFVSASSLARSQWAKEVFNIDGKQFIVVPPEFLVGVRP